MARLIRIFCFMILLLCSIFNKGQNVKPEYIDFEKKVGKHISVFERNRFELFPDIEEKKFKAARVIKVSDSLYYLEIIKRDKTLEKTEISSWDLYLLKEKIRLGGDSMRQISKRRKNYFFTRLHLYYGLGSPVRLYGNTFQEYAASYPMGIESSYNEKSFGGSPTKEHRSNQLNIGVSVNITPRLYIEAWTLPTMKKKFEGGNGSNRSYYSQNWFFPSTEHKTFGKGKRIEENIYASGGLIDFGYELIPHKQLSFFGFSVSGGIGAYWNSLDINTTLWIYDMASSSAGGMAIKSYFQNEKRYGAMIHLKPSLWVGELLSVFCRASYGMEQFVEITEKELIYNNQVAVAKKHYEYLGGFGMTFGIGLNLIKQQTGIKKAKKNG